MSVVDGVNELESDWFKTVYVEHRKLPLRRAAEPGEIAAHAAWLCSGANTYLTGQVITVDGGAHGHVLMPAILHTGLTVRDLDRSLALLPRPARDGARLRAGEAGRLPGRRSSATRTRTCGWRTSRSGATARGSSSSSTCGPSPWASRRSRATSASRMSACCVDDLAVDLRAAARRGRADAFGARARRHRRERRRPGPLPARPRRRARRALPGPSPARRAHEAAGQGVRGDRRGAWHRPRDRRGARRRGRAARRSSSSTSRPPRRSRRSCASAGSTRAPTRATSSDRAAVGRGRGAGRGRARPVRRARQQRRPRAHGPVARLPRGRVAALDRRHADRRVLLLPGVRAPARRARRGRS